MPVRFAQGALATALMLAVAAAAGPAADATAVRSGHKMAGGGVMYPNRTVLENAASARELSTLVMAAKAAGLAETLAGPGPFTIFAPTNAAFGKLPDGTVETLIKPVNRPTLTAIISYHIVPGRLTSRELLAEIRSGGGKASLTTVNGESLIASVKEGRLLLTDAQGGTATVTQKDLPQANGVLHVVDTVLMP